jgi:hypothetical protein
MGGYNNNNKKSPSSTSSPEVCALEQLYLFVGPVLWNSFHIQYKQQHIQVSLPAIVCERSERIFELVVTTTTATKNHINTTPSQL